MVMSKYTRGLDLGGGGDGGRATTGERGERTRSNDEARTTPPSRRHGRARRSGRGRGRLPREPPSGDRRRPLPRRRSAPARAAASAGTRSSPSQFRPHRPREVPSRSAHTRSRPSRPRRPREVPSRRPSHDPVPSPVSRCAIPSPSGRSCRLYTQEQGVSKHTVKMRKTRSPVNRGSFVIPSLRLSVRATR